jgi:hypothetical protein
MGGEMNKQATAIFLRAVAIDYEEKRATPIWELPSIIANCLRNTATRLEKEDQQRCESCKYWRPVTDPKHIWSVCELTKDNAAGISVEEGVVQTRANFGCVQWESR